MDIEMEITEVTEEELVPCLLKESIEDVCCIFRAPTLLLETNPRAFRPCIVSIGPYHSNTDRRLQMLQQHKPRFVELFLETANRNGSSMSMASLENVVGELEKDIRESYSEHLQLSREELVKMMVLDGCFVLMLISVMTHLVKLTNPNDTIITLPWIVPTLMSDLLLLENQVPYILLETLLAKLGCPDHVDLKRMICVFFECSLGHMSERVFENTKKIHPRHLLHLIRETLIPASSYKPQGESSSGKGMPEFIVSARKLQQQGMKFKVKTNTDTILDIELEGNTLCIPPLILHKLLDTLLLNSVAFEQNSRICGDDVTSYMVFMGFLMKDNEDALFMCNEKIVENCFGTNEEASHFFKGVIKGVAFDLSRSCLAPVFRGINSRTSRCGSKYFADLKRYYYGTPIARVTTVAGVVFLSLTVAQVVIAALSFQNDLKGKGGGAT